MRDTQSWKRDTEVHAHYAEQPPTHLIESMAGVYGFLAASGEQLFHTSQQVRDGAAVGTLLMDGFVDVLRRNFEYSLVHPWV